MQAWRGFLGRDLLKREDGWRLAYLGALLLQEVCRDLGDLGESWIIQQDVGARYQRDLYCTTEKNGIRCALLRTHDRTMGPCLVAMHEILLQ
jgi:hypothetical protein